MIILRAQGSLRVGRVIVLGWPLGRVRMGSLSAASFPAQQLRPPVARPVARPAESPAPSRPPPAARSMSRMRGACSAGSGDPAQTFGCRLRAFASVSAFATSCPTRRASSSACAIERIFSWASASCCRNAEPPLARRAVPRARACATSAARASCSAVRKCSMPRLRFSQAERSRVRTHPLSLAIVMSAISLAPTLSSSDKPSSSRPPRPPRPPRRPQRPCRSRWCGRHPHTW
mmetsp:Transcript_32313/g.80084  ORF Transcript_32313/g.80084 Transcript_32313/m.80084 type:complete len:232 (+) Transcript_32313:295-990(+)